MAKVEWNGCLSTCSPLWRAPPRPGRKICVRQLDVGGAAAACLREQLECRHHFAQPRCARRRRRAHSGRCVHAPAVFHGRAVGGGGDGGSLGRVFVAAEVRARRVLVVVGKPARSRALSPSRDEGSVGIMCGATRRNTSRRTRATCWPRALGSSMSEFVNPGTHHTKTQRRCPRPEPQDRVRRGANTQKLLWATGAYSTSFVPLGTIWKSRSPHGRSRELAGGCRGQFLQTRRMVLVSCNDRPSPWPAML